MSNLINDIGLIMNTTEKEKEKERDVTIIIFDLKDLYLRQGYWQGMGYDMNGIYFEIISLI